MAEPSFRRFWRRPARPMVSVRRAATSPPAQCSPTWPWARGGALRGATLGSGSRRCVVKARLVELGTVGARSIATHLQYISREGVSREEGQHAPTTSVSDVPLMVSWTRFRCRSPRSGAAAICVRRALATRQRAKPCGSTASCGVADGPSADPHTMRLSSQARSTQE